MAEDITISGQLRSYDQKPIFMIKVTVYRDEHFVDHGYTNEEGRYAVSVPIGEPITLRFDTHYSLTNARDWHPSVVANVDATHDIVLNRFLLRVGTDEGGQTGFVDALTAYQFCAMWTAEGLEPEYAESAVRRLGPFKLTTRVLQDIRQVLQEHFVKQIKAQP
jgi:hypothetical protein